MITYEKPKFLISQLISRTGWDATLTLSSEERTLMEKSTATLNRKVAAGERVYGVTQGFGPLVRYQADSSSQTQGLGLISHLATGQGEPITPEVTRYMLWLRLSGMKQGHSAVDPDFWLKLAALWNVGYTPVVPRDGSISASGDLIPLAHAAQSLAGFGEAWAKTEDGKWKRVPARERFNELGLDPCVWTAREALAFVNGTSASLAVTSYNHYSIVTMARCLAALSGRMAYLLGANPEAYSAGISEVRNQPGQIQVATWIRSELASDRSQDLERPLQEPYSLRCAPQVIGAVVDQLRLQETILIQEALGCTDNPVVYGDEVLHGGNFHAIPVGLCSDQHALCAHQLAFLAERQLAMMVDPTYNSNLPPMLTPYPGPQSGFAGVQIAATSFVAKIRQLSYPSSLTALPTNLNNQDHVPMALNGANSVVEINRFGWLVIGSLGMAINQWSHLAQVEAPEGTVWAELQSRFKPLELDRPLAAEVLGMAEYLQQVFSC